MKKCSECGIDKPLTTKYFSRIPGHRRFKEICNTCLEQQQEDRNLREIERRKEYYQSRKEWYAQRYQDNKEQIRQSYYDNKEYYDAYHKQYRLDNPNYYNDYAKEYYKENKEHKREYSKQYRKDNPEIYRFHNQKRAAMKNNLPHTLTSEEWDEIIYDFNHSCAYCGISEKDHLEKWNEILHQEHVIPVSSGGGYEVGNIIPACRNCNSSKSNQDFFEWYPSYKHYNEDRMNFILTYLNIDTKQQNKVNQM